MSSGGKRTPEDPLVFVRAGQKRAAGLREEGRVKARAARSNAARKRRLAAVEEAPKPEPALPPFLSGDTSALPKAPPGRASR